MKSYKRPKEDTHWGEYKGKDKGKDPSKGKGKGKDPKGKGKGDPGGKGPYADAAGDGSTSAQGPGQLQQQEGYDPAEHAWEESQSGWQEADWSKSTSWYESGFAAVQQHPLAATSSTVPLNCEASTSYFMNLSTFPMSEVPDSLWTFPKTAEGINLMANPLYVILDIGCTKSMGSRHAIEAFRQHCGPTGISTEILPSSSYFTFAGGSGAKISEKCRIWFPTEPPTYTDVDICE